MKMVRRFQVLNALVFLIAIMIIINLYTLLLVAKGATQTQTQFQDNYLNDIRKLNSRSNIRINDSMISARFINDHGELALNAPTSILTREMETLFANIMDKYYVTDIERKSKAYSSRLVKRLVKTLRYSSKKSSLDPKYIWSLAADWPFTDWVRLQNLDEILRMTNKAEIQKSKNSERGTQLKIEVTLEGGQIALFKPQWYSRETLVIHGNVYGGKDRHFGEIAAFYLNLLLGYNAAPITVGRTVDLENEILPFADAMLKNTFYNKTGSLCFYGVCYFCKKEDSVCTNNNKVEGALILLLDHKFRTVANPWRRTYKEDQPANWETNMNFCERVMNNKKPSKKHETILDIVAVSIFDFLIGNGDRHHFELYSKIPDNDSHSRSILLIDNGKSFGNPYEDFIDILAPLYQCCKIRQSLLSTLVTFQGALGRSMDYITMFDPVYPILSATHLSALDRRLSIVLATVQVCMEKQSATHQVVF